MAVIQKTLFAKNLDKYAVLVNDTEPNSRYFKITELPDTFTGGKNAFLVAGSKELVPDTKIQIELRDSAGNIIYHEPGEGYISSSLNGTPFVTEYYEGVSKVVSVYVYPDTAYGPCTLTILGELSEYTDTNGIVVPVGLDWENKYNVKWTKTINVNPALANTTKIRFYQRPTATITEILSPIYSIVGDNKVASAVTQSFANIKLSKLETFAGDVKRVKVFRTSQGDISDYDLIQDILIESKELLTSYGLSGSVVGETGILTSETLKNNWNTGSLNAFLTSSRVESGVRLTGSGYFTYTSSLDIKSANTYELNLDAFYSASISTNLGIYLVSGSSSSSIATLNGTAPTKNLLDTVIPFKVDKDFVSASLYFSQSQGEWHLGNISLKLSQDTAFSPDEISFVTTMPTVLGNETFNFKFEFYDVNNNYVPVAVTQSATFNGGNTNIGGTILLISSSASSSLADLNRVSSSISGTMTTYSSSASGSINIVSGSVNTLSGSVSSSINTLSGSISSSIALTLSSSLSKVKQLADGQYTGVFIDGTTVFAPVIGGTTGYISKLLTVGSTSAATINLDARNIADGAGDNLRRIWIGSGTYGLYNNTNTSVYLDSVGKFSLKNKLTWDGTNLSVNGSITITNPSTANNGGAIGSFNNGDALTAGTIAGVTISSDKIYIGTGTHNNSNTAFYVDNTGKFSLKDKLSWDGTNLSVNGSITITNTIPNTSISGLGALSTQNTVTNTQVTGLGALATRNNVNLSLVTDAGAMAAISSITAGNASTYIGAGAIVSNFIAANTIVAGNIASDTITATNISSLNFYSKTAKFDTGDVGGWTLASGKIYNTNVDIDNANERIDFKSSGVVKTRLLAGNANIGTPAYSAINIPAQGSSNDFYQGNGSTIGPQDKTFTLSQSITETSITTPSGTTGNKLSLKIPTYTIGTLGTVNFTNMGNALTFNYGYKAYVTYKVSSAPGGAGDISSGTYYFYNGYYNDFTGITSAASFPLPGVNGGSIPVYSGTATAGQVFYISATYYIQILTRANMSSGYPFDPVDSSANWYVSSPGWTSVSSNAVIVAVANRAEYGSNGIQIGTGDGNYAAMGDAAGSGLSGLFNGSVQIYGTLTAALASSSDRRAKTNIKPLENATDTLKKLNPVSFDWLQHQINTTDFKHSYGFIADEVQTILPNLVLEKRGLEYDDFKYLDYNSFHALAIKAILELTEKVEKLEAKISGSI